MEFNPVNYLGIAILGAALLWAVRLVYGRRRGSSDDLVKRWLLLAGWILLLGGLLGVISLSGPLFPLAFIILVIAGFSYFKYMAAERRALLWALAMAAEKDIPLAKAARAFADERSVQVGVRMAHLADLLESGVPLPSALALSKNVVPSDALLAARLGEETGQLGVALRMSVDYSDDFELIMRNVMAKYFYLTGLLVVGTGVVSFMMVKIVPVFSKMFEEFELQLPHGTRVVISVSEYYYILFPLVYPILLLLLLIGISYFVRWSRYELPWVNRLWRRCDSALVMRALALTVRQQREMGPTVFMLARQYPYPSVGRLLALASKQIDDGVHWCDALRSVGLIKSAEASLLRAAERVGNLAWGLEEMSDSALRRFSFRLRAGLNILFPLIVLACGFVVLFFVIGMFLPLVVLIDGLS
jgi:type II secretory pathway component PulF